MSTFYSPDNFDNTDRECYNLKYLRRITNFNDWKIHGIVSRTVTVQRFFQGFGREPFHIMMKIMIRDFFRE